jgi:hypothetical protein
MPDDDDEQVTCEKPDCEETELEDVSQRIGDTLWIYWVCSDHVGWAEALLDAKRDAR